MSGIVPFAFQLDENKVIRTSVDLDGRAWFVAKDILKAVESTTTVTRCVKTVSEILGPEHCVIISLQDSVGRVQHAKAVSEQGLYLTVLRSPKCVSLLPLVTSRVTGFTEIIRALEDFETPDDLPDMYVYAIREVDTRKVKLGISRDPERRLKCLQTGNSSRLELVAYRKAHHRFADEAALHKEADSHRLRGEWFSEAAAAFVA